MGRVTIDAQSQQLGAAGFKLGLRLGKGKKLGGADRRKVAGVRKKNDPFALIVGQLDGPEGGGCGKIGRLHADADTVVLHAE